VAYAERGAEHYAIPNERRGPTEVSILTIRSRELSRLAQAAWLFIAAMNCYVPGILPLGKTFVFLGFLYSGVPLSDLWIAVPNRVDFQSFQISECACSSIPSVKQSVTFWARLNHCPLLPQLGRNRSRLDDEPHR
jgi:hypothetical protein